jgi:hypothetical protein
VTTRFGLPIERVERRILLIRGQKVLLDADLSALYGVTTKRFNEQVRRNAARFPADFMFQLSSEEWRSLRSHFASLKAGRGRHRKYPPLAFKLMAPPEPKRRPIGFVVPDDRKRSWK